MTRKKTVKKEHPLLRNPPVCPACHFALWPVAIHNTSGELGPFPGWSCKCRFNILTPDEFKALFGFHFTGVGIA